MMWRPPDEDWPKGQNKNTHQSNQVWLDNIRATWTAKANLVVEAAMSTLVTIAADKSLSLTKAGIVSRDRVLNLPSSEKRKLPYFV